MEADIKRTIFLNSIAGILNRVVICILGMVFRKIFILYLGESISGLSSLYTNILNFLSIATAGLGATAIHKIYICNAENDLDEIIKIERFSRLFFRTVSIFIFTCGILFSIFLDQLILNNEYSKMFLQTVFFLQMLSECINYWFSSKRIILQALEKLYIISYIEMITNIVMYIIQIMIVAYTRNYYLYLITLVIKYGVIGYFIHMMSVREYPWLKKKCSFMLKDMKYLFTDLKNTVFLQVSTFIFISTDSLVISTFLGLVQINLYDNYMIIINTLTSAVDEINEALRASFGNLLAKESNEENKLNFLFSTTFIQFMIALFFSVSLKCLMPDFIEIWLGKKFILPEVTSDIIIINLYCTFLSRPLKNYMIMCGKFETDKKITFSSAVANLFLSIALVRSIGLSGVILGTLIGNIAMWIERGVFFFKKFDKKVLVLYSLELVKYFSVTMIALAATTKITDYSELIINNIFITFVIKMIVCMFIPNFIVCLFFRNRKEVKKIIGLLRWRTVHEE